MTKKSLIAVSLVLALGLGVGAALAAERQPSATLELSEGSVAVGIGFSWGGGTLTYAGKTYPISVDGLTLGSVGVTSAKATGTVYNLKDIKDFDGVYTAAKAGLTVGKGGAAAEMVNVHGVAIELLSSTEGAKITFGSGGVKLKIRQ